MQEIQLNNNFKKWTVQEYYWWNAFSDHFLISQCIIYVPSLPLSLLLRLVTIVC